MARYLAVILVFITIVLCGDGDPAERTPLRIVSLAPSTTEILFALGLADSIVGVSSYCNYPPQAGSIEKMGTFSNPDYEKIVASRPTIVFMVGLEQALARERLEELNIRTYVSYPSNFEELFQSIREMAQLTGSEEKADALIAEMSSGLARVERSLEHVPFEKRPAIFFEIWDQPLMTAGKGSFIDDIIARAGGRNIAYDTIRPFCYFSSEAVIERNPDYVVIGYMTKRVGLTNVQKRLGWEGISAVKNKMVIDDIDPDIMLRPGPRSVGAVVELHDRFYRREPL